MIVDIVMPKMGESIMEGTIIEWKKAVGDAVELDETLLEISTDKVDSEIPSAAAGTLVEILHEPNTTVDVGTVIARIGTEGEKPGAKFEKQAAKPEEEGPTAPRFELEEVAEAETVEPKQEAAPPSVTASAPTPSVLRLHPPGAAYAGQAGPRRFYSPLVRSIAAKEGVSQEELDGISGSGRDSRVTKSDILAYLEVRKVAVPVSAPAAPTAPVPVPAPAGGELADQVVPMSRIRQRTAEHMRRSIETSAHVYSISECDMTAAVAFREEDKGAFLKREGIKLTYTPMIAYATIRAIRDFPLINARLEGTNIIQHRHINMGIAVSLADDNLIVPVIHRAEELNFLGLARAAADLAQRARGNQLKPEEATGSTFTITNPGIYGNLIGLPIINQPNVAILSVGAIKKRAVVWESQMGDSLVIRSMMAIALGYDHRLIDGAYGSRFLQRIVHHLETMDWPKVL